MDACRVCMAVVAAQCTVRPLPVSLRGLVRSLFVLYVLLMSQ